MKSTFKKTTSILLAAGMLASAITGMTAMAEEQEHYPGFEVYFREGIPTADIDVEITSDEEVTWTVACCLTEDNPQGVNIGRIAEDLKEMTNGKFIWDVYYNNELGNENEVVELTRNNTVQFVTSNPTTMAQYVEDAGVFALPYLFHSPEDALTYLSTSEKSYDIWKRLEEQTNLFAYGFQCSGARTLSTKGIDQISRPEDLKGTKIRCMDSQVWMDVISALGATPVPVAYTELYTALQTGVVSGQENPAGHTVDGKFYEVLDTFYENQHSYLISGMFGNSQAFDALPDDYKALLLALVQKYEGDQYKEDIDVYTADCYKTIEESGVKIVPQSELDMDAFYASATAMIDEKYMSNESFAAIIEDVKATFGY